MVYVFMYEQDNSLYEHKLYINCGIFRVNAFFLQFLDESKQYVNHISFQHYILTNDFCSRRGTYKTETMVGKL